MSFNRLTIQSLQAARQRAAYSGLSGLGDASDEALRGAVVDVVISIGQAWRVVSYTSTLTRKLVDVLNASGFRVLNIDDSNLALLTGGSVRARVQILTDGYATAKDAASVVAGAAAALGYNVTGNRGALVSSAPASNGAPVATSGQVFDPSTAPGSKPPASGNPLTDFFSGLTQSPVTLAVILGAAVVLVIAAKK